MFLALVNNSYSQELFKQDFSSSTTLSSYISATPTIGQFNAIAVTGSGTSANTASNALQFIRGSGNTSFTRSTNFSPTATAIVYQFDLTVNGVKSNTNLTARWQIGKNYLDATNGIESDLNTYAQMAIDFRSSGSGKFRFNDIKNNDESDNYSYGTTYAITWVMNNSGSTITYVSPTGSNETVPNDKMDFWVDNTKIFNDRNVQTSLGSIENMKFAFTGSTGNIIMDNMLIQSMNTPQNGSNSFNGSPICNGETGQLTLTMSAGEGPFTVVYNDGSTRTVTGVLSGVPFDVVVNPTATKTYTLTSVTEASGAIRTSGFGDSSATITVQQPSTANAGTAVSTCFTSGAVNITAGSSAGNHTSVLWSSNGTGTFANATSLTTSTYTPSAADILAGNVILTLTAIGNSPCGNVFSTKNLTINSGPSTTGVSICQGGSGALTSSVVCPSGSATSVGPNNAATGSSITGIGNTAWTNTGNVISDNNAYTSASLAGSSAVSNYLRSSNYSFSIPVTATINGIQVTIGRYSDNGNTRIRDNEVRLVKAGTVTGDNNANAGVNWPTSKAGITYGGVSDLWATAWSASDINNSNFGVALSVLNATGVGATYNALVDYIEVTVTYTVPGSIEWYTASSGGTLLGSGSPFNPVGVSGSGLPNTNTPGTYTFYAECSAVAGCRSATTFVINPITTVGSLTTTACDTYTWAENGQTYMVSGVYTNTVGCNTATLNLTINNSTSGATTAIACDTYTWEGPLGNSQTYTTSGTYTSVTTNASGCSHTETLNLTINSSTSSSMSVTACDSYVWSVNGQTYTTSGIKNFITTNASGCPFTQTLDLTINYSTSGSNDATACDNYTWDGPLGNGTTYTVSGIYTNVTTNVLGCPHTQTLDLTINSSTSSST